MKFPVQPIPLILTDQEVADILKCSVTTVQRYVHEHKLTAIRIGRERRYRAADVMEFIDRQPSTARTGN